LSLLDSRLHDVPISKMLKLQNLSRIKPPPCSLVTFTISTRFLFKHSSPRSIRKFRYRLPKNPFLIKSLTQNHLYKEVSIKFKIINLYSILATATVTFAIIYITYIAYLDFNSYKRNAVAWWYVGKVLVRYKLKGSKKSSKDHEYCGEQFLQLALANGGVYVKIGQHLSALSHVLPKEMCKKLEPLQTKCTQQSFESVQKMLRDELGLELVREITELRGEPEGTASIAQVHRAKIGGNDVAIKVQHAMIAKNAEEDMRTLATWASRARRHFGEKFNFMWLVNEIRDMLVDELDFRKEASNATEARQNHAHLPWLVIPKVYQEFTTERILVMNYELGHAIDDHSWYIKNQVDANQVVANISYLFNEMVFVTGFLHSDPHAGNLKIRKSGPIGPVQVILLDHGQYKRLTSIFRHDYCNFLHAIVSSDVPKVKKYAKRLNIANPDLAATLACMMTGVRWNNITDKGGLQARGRANEGNWGSGDVAEQMVDKYLDQALEILDKVPPELGLIMKSNDLIRCLESKLTAGSTAETYTNMAYLCITGMKMVELSNAISPEDRAAIYWKYFLPLMYNFMTRTYFLFYNLTVDRWNRWKQFFTRTNKN